MPGRALVATVIEPKERPRFDTAAGGRFAAYHASTLGDAIRVVRERPVNAVLLSPRCIASDQLAGVATLVSGFPTVPTVAVVSRHDATSSRRLLQLGAYGVRKMVDLSDRGGWQALRAIVAHPATPTTARMLAAILPALGECTHDCRRFFGLLVRLAPSVSTVRTLARTVGAGASTFMSRFFRARVPSPKRYLVATRLVHAAGLLDARGLSIADVAYRLEYSSPQSFGRHLRTVLGMTAGEFRRRYPFSVALDEFISRLIVPFQPRFRTFRPLEQGVGALGQSW
ncbi:MAG: helix-turn-helix domain-containing protein [Gemmatimonadales bacterium]|nr:helix-turn-helix domain-containing protein [Gemmatimonadales bacterium]